MSKTAIDLIVEVKRMFEERGLPVPSSIAFQKRDWKKVGPQIDAEMDNLRRSPIGPQHAAQYWVHGIAVELEHKP